MDDYDTFVCAAAEELGRRGELPTSIKMMNDAARDFVLAGGLRPGVFTRAVLDDRMPRGVAAFGDGERPPIFITGIE